jgi:hypothetical protein
MIMKRLIVTILLLVVSEIETMEPTVQKEKKESWNDMPPWLQKMTNAGDFFPIGWCRLDNEESESFAGMMYDPPSGEPFYIAFFFPENPVVINICSFFYNKPPECSTRLPTNQYCFGSDPGKKTIRDIDPLAFPLPSLESRKLLLEYCGQHCLLLPK